MRATRVDRDLDRDARIVQANVFDDLTMEEIGLRYGVTRQRIHQILTRTDPTLTRLARRRRKARTKLRMFVRDTSAPVVGSCALCGKTFEASPRGRPRDRNVYCSPVHRQAYLALRYQLGDDDRRDDQRRALARNVIRSGVGGARERYARRVLAGTVGEGETSAVAGKRWIVPGSVAFHWAVRAYVLGWPVFERLPEPIRNQIRTHVDGPDPDEDGHAA